MPWIKIVNETKNEVYYIPCELPDEGKDGGGEVTFHGCRIFNDKTYGKVLKIPCIKESQFKVKPNRDANIVFTCNNEDGFIKIPIGEEVTQEISIKLTK